MKFLNSIKSSSRLDKVRNKVSKMHIKLETTYNKNECKLHSTTSLQIQSNCKERLGTAEEVMEELVSSERPEQKNRLKREERVLDNLA